MTDPHDPAQPDPNSESPGRVVRRGRHWAPGQDDDSDEVTEPVAGEAQPSDEDADADDAPTSDDPPADAAPSDDPPAEAAPSDDPPADSPTSDDPQPAETSASGRTGDEHPGGEPSDPPSSASEQPEPFAAVSDLPAGDSEGATDGPRHAASGSGFRLQRWMIAVAAVIIVALVAWLVIALVSGGDDTNSNAATNTTATSEKPQPVDAASLPQLLCMGQSYIVIDTGKSTEQLLADPKTVERQFPESQLSTIPPGCIAGSTERDEVVLALGPFPTIEDACAAGKELTGVGFQAYAGSASTGLTATTCPA